MSKSEKILLDLNGFIGILQTLRRGALLLTVSAGIFLGVTILIGIAVFTLGMVFASLFEHLILPQILGISTSHSIQPELMVFAELLLVSFILSIIGFIIAIIGLYVFFIRGALKLGRMISVLRSPSLLLFIGSISFPILFVIGLLFSFLRISTISIILIFSSIIIALIGFLWFISRIASIFNNDLIRKSSSLLILSLIVSILSTIIIPFIALFTIVSSTFSTELSIAGMVILTLLLALMTILPMLSFYSLYRGLGNIIGLVSADKSRKESEIEGEAEIEYEDFSEEDLPPPPPRI